MVDTKFLGFHIYLPKEPQNNPVQFEVPVMVLTGNLNVSIIFVGLNTSYIKLKDRVADNHNLETSYRKLRENKLKEKSQASTWFKRLF